MAALDRGETGSIYNLGSGIGRSNLDVVEAMVPLLQEMGRVVRTVHESERPFDVRANVLDSGRLVGHTGWKPVVGFEEGLLRTRDWLIGHHHD
jgi:UDP-glucose 4-epimerase